MPRFGTVKKALVVGSGGIVIGQAAEFDYSGSQCLKALREEGIKTVLINPNVATIQTSPRMADAIYLEPITPEIVEQIIQKEKPDGVLLAFGGQTALNVGVELNRRGVFEREGVKVLGTPIKTIADTEDRELFRQAMISANVPIPASRAVYSVPEALETAGEIGYPVIARVAYVLGGGGSGIAYNEAELRSITAKALELSMEHQVLIEDYLPGWKEIENEIMRDYADNTIVVASMENFDPMGIHTGDSIVLAPTQTLSNRESHMLREASIRVIRALGVVGECNIQFGLDPNSERYVAIEVNARMSRSSALASKATGYPLAYIATKLALGYTLPELSNKVTGITTACFEPSLDYVVVKIPRWDFNKFPGQINRLLGPQMKSVGEVMSIGRTFEEALQKAIRGLDIGKLGLVCNSDEEQSESLEELKRQLKEPTDERVFKVVKALKLGLSPDEIYQLSGIDPWFLHKMENILRMENVLAGMSHEDENITEVLRKAKTLGFSDKQIAKIFKMEEDEVRELRKEHGVKPAFKIIDTMAGEWESRTNYCYTTYGDTEDDVDFNGGKKKALLLGAGCIRIGSSVEFDYCTMNTAWSLKEEGIDEIIVLNNNPETVSTDYDMSDKLYFEEMSLERVLDIVEAEKPLGVVVSVGGQVPNNLAFPLEKHGVKLIGTSGTNIDRAEDRSKFSSMLDSLNIPQPQWRSVLSLKSAQQFASNVGYPVLVRPSYVLSGAAMKVANSPQELSTYIRKATEISPEHPVVISKFFEGAKEVEMDAVSDGEDVLMGEVMEHIELAGTHSGDATMVLPPQTLTDSEIKKIKTYTREISREIGIRGPFNIQFLVKGGTVYIIELNLRASRSMPYTSKSTGIPLIYLGAKVMLGKTLKELKVEENVRSIKHVGIKTPTFSFVRLKGVDPILGVEMNSTGEVACLDSTLAGAMLKAFMAAGLNAPAVKKFVLLTVRKDDREIAGYIAKHLQASGYPLLATDGTSEVLRSYGVTAMELGKVSEGIKSIPNMISTGDIGLVINVPSAVKGKSLDDSYIIRRSAVEHSVPVITRIETAHAFVRALAESKNKIFDVKPLHSYHDNSVWSKHI
jgi:carbamoyl-phosphate synthase large subunit